MIDYLELKVGDVLWEYHGVHIDGRGESDIHFPRKVKVVAGSSNGNLRCQVTYVGNPDSLPHWGFPSSLFRTLEEVVLQMEKDALKVREDLKESYESNLRQLERTLEEWREEVNRCRELQVSRQGK